MGGETLLPFAGAGLNETGCGGCDRTEGATVDRRANACYACLRPRAAELLADCASPDNPGVAVAPRAGRLLLWYNYQPDGTFEPAAMHAGCPVLVGEKWAANIWLDRRDGVPLFSDAPRRPP